MSLRGLARRRATLLQPREAGLDRLQQYLLVHGLGQEIDGPAPEGAPAGRHVAMAGHDHDRPAISLRTEPFEEL